MTVLREYLVEAVSRHGDRPAVVDRGRTWTYRELLAAAASAARHLQDLGAEAGTPVALLMHNRVEYLVADLAVAMLGAAKVPLNTMLSAQEHAYMLRDSGARICLAERELWTAAEQAADGPLDATAILVEDGAWQAVVSGAPIDKPGPVADDEHGVIMYTGGTTGRPKGVVHTQRSLAMNLLSHLLEMDLHADDVLLLTSPLPHSAGFLAQAALTRGATVHLEQRFDPAAVVDRIERDRITYLFLVPTMIYRLLDEISGRASFDGTSVRTILYGAAPITTERLRQGLATFGPVFVQLYGQTEAPNFITRLRRDDHRVDPGREHRLRSCGQPVLMTQVRIRREDGSECPAGEVGEVTARTPYTTVGYLNRPKETGEALRDGWLHTGDLGYVDEDGFLYLVDRKKDMIITGGLNVYTAEVERGLSQIPGVREVCVVGVPHPDWGEAVVAYVVAEPEADLTPEKVMAGARDRLTSYKRPKAVVMTDRLPTTAVGKIDKKALRDRWPGW